MDIPQTLLWVSYDSSSKAESAYRAVNRFQIEQAASFAEAIPLLPVVAGVVICGEPSTEELAGFADQGRDVANTPLPILLLRESVPTPEDIRIASLLGAVEYLPLSLCETLLDAKLGDLSGVTAAPSQSSQSLISNEVLLQAIDSVLIVVGQDEAVAYWNSWAEEYFDLQAGDVEGRSILSLKLDWDWPSIDSQIQTAIKTGESSSRFQVDYQSPELGPRILSVGIIPFVLETAAEGRSEDESDWGYMIIAFDITEKKQEEAQKNRSEKLQSIGQLASGIAHEINTPIQFVGDNTHFLKDAFGDLLATVGHFKQLIAKAESASLAEADVQAFSDQLAESDIDYLESEIPAALDQCADGIERVSKIVQSMKDFTHPGSDEKMPTDLNRAIESTLTVASHVWKYVADVETNYGTGLDRVPCFASPFNEVVLNLVVNAAHAIEDVVNAETGEKGRIVISTAIEGDFAEVAIEDSGKGIPDSIGDKVFDPFFTTKEVGKGTGQGLSLSHKIITEVHGGELSFTSEPEVGTRFLIRLPLL